jgi:methionyl-tRNA formyltransferase
MTKRINRSISFRGPAPLHHTLLAGEITTGVTVQTLHHESFDHGVILSQTPLPGFDIPNADSCTVPDLVNLVAPKGAQMLVESIDKGLYVSPLKDVGYRSPEDTGALIHASKITPEDRHVNWAEWSSADIIRRNRVIGPLWSKVLCATNDEDSPPSFQQKRVIFTDVEEVDPPDMCESFSILPGLPFAISYLPDEPRTKRHLYVFTADGKVLRIHRMKVEGKEDSGALAAAYKARMFGDKGFQYGDREMTPFRNPFV